MSIPILAFQWIHVFVSAAAAAKSLQSCLTLCDPIDVSPPGSPVPGILQARILEWVAISSSSAWKWKVKVKLLSHAWLLATPRTAVYQASPSMGFSRQEYWSGVPLPSPFVSGCASKNGIARLLGRWVAMCWALDREAWHAAVHGVAKSRTWLSDWTELDWTKILPNSFQRAFTNLYSH